MYILLIGSVDGYRVAMTQLKLGKNIDDELDFLLMS